MYSTDIHVVSRGANVSQLSFFDILTQGVITYPTVWVSRQHCCRLILLLTGLIECIYLFNTLGLLGVLPWWLRSGTLCTKCDKRAFLSSTHRVDDESSYHIWSRAVRFSLRLPLGGPRNSCSRCLPPPLLYFLPLIEWIGNKQTFIGFEKLCLRNCMQLCIILIHRMKEWNMIECKSLVWSHEIFEVHLPFTQYWIENIDR